MTNLLLHNYYYRYRGQRKLVRDIIVGTGDFVGAKTKLDSVIIEYNSKYSGSDKKDFNYGEKIMLIHARDHLNAVIDKNDPGFFDNGVLKHHSDIVKEGLLRVPKSDYTDTGTE